MQQLCPNLSGNKNEMLVVFNICSKYQNLEWMGHGSFHGWSVCEHEKMKVMMAPQNNAVLYICV